MSKEDLFFQSCKIYFTNSFLAGELYLKSYTSWDMSFLRRMAGSWTDRGQYEMFLTNIEGQGGIEVSTPTQLETGYVRAHIDTELSEIPVPKISQDDRELETEDRVAQREGDRGIGIRNGTEVMSPDSQGMEGNHMFREPV